MVSAAREMSFTAAEAYPIKVLLDKELVCSIMNSMMILPRHIQLNPTNFCNLRCGWCSCSHRDKRLQMDLETIYNTMEKFKAWGARSVTITGGGEPLMHPNIEEIIKFINALGIEIGLVTNGWLLGRLDESTLSKITWIRVSLGDERKNEGKKYWKSLYESVGRGAKCDWSFSYVTTEKPHLDLIAKMVRFANVCDFTHIRLVNDIFQADKLSRNMPLIKKELEGRKIKEGRVIYQSRSTWTPGTRWCYISLLKPVVGADGFIYPCCGTQYALKEPSRDYEKSMRMGTVNDIDDIVSSQKYFDGRKCVKCYYSSYNNLIAALLSGIKHRGFV